MRRLGDQRGWTLIELLTTMSLMGLVFGATLTLFVGFHRNERIDRLQNESQDQAHQSIERLTRQLRNLASPRDFDPAAVELALPNDFVFKTVDPLKPNGTENDRNIKRVRYCLGASSGNKEVLWAQQQTWTTPNPPPTIPSTATCPSAAWGNQTVITEDLVNREQNESVFGYTPEPAGSPPSDDERASIRAVQVKLWTDVNPGKRPAATRLASGVFLRNQNRAPVASCTATWAGNNQVVLNGSASEDPEGRPLRGWEWLKGGAAFDPPLKGVVARWSATGPGVYAFSVKVTDYGGLTAVANCDQPVVVP
jgi:prepilin-type N-terminal cleavage/methylation domain-containing protein